MAIKKAKPKTFIRKEAPKKKSSVKPVEKVQAPKQEDAKVINESVIAKKAAKQVTESPNPNQIEDIIVKTSSIEVKKVNIEETPVAQTKKKEEPQEPVLAATPVASPLGTEEVTPVVEEATEEEPEEDTETVEKKEERDEEENIMDEHGSSEKSEEETSDIEKEEMTEEKKGGSWLMSGIAVTIVVLGVIGWGLYFREKFIAADKKAAVTEVVTPTDTPTPTLEEVAKDEYSIQVLNGSGTAGEATKVKTTLEEEGYKVPLVGNAKNQTYTETVMQVKEGTPEAVITAIKTILEATYVIGEREVLDESDVSDIVIIVGSEQAE